MQHYVLNQTALRPLEQRVVFAALDTDREENAAFIERYAVSVWPTFFVIDPANERVVGYWPGSASLTEMRRFIEDSLDSLDPPKSGDAGRDPALDALLRAKAAQAQGEHARAAELYERAVQSSERSWRRRSEALSGLVEVLFRLGKAEPCVEIGLRHLKEVEGAARPTDYTALVFECTKGLPAARRNKPRQTLIARLRELAENPSREQSPDDRADTLHRLADALVVAGDKEGARRAHEARLAILEDAASRAPSPDAAATYDYGRASAYVSLGRAEQAVRMLEQREKQLPNSYEPPARLASVLTELGRFSDARAAIDRALVHAYGPRRLRYLALKAKLQGNLADHAGQVATLEEELRGHIALKRNERDPSRQDAQQRLARARAVLRNRP
jgi:tetratricopeptide (TPR) repeat protein